MKKSSNKDKKKKSIISNFNEMNQENSNEGEENIMYNWLINFQYLSVVVDNNAFIEDKSVLLNMDVIISDFS